ncbi:MAG: hypothetical protein AAF152_19045 [Cyanobacteria bacterium P01_A01_bin.114]
MNDQNLDQNPLRNQLKQDLETSEWLQKFKAINQLLQTLKAEIPLTRLCDLKWDTTHDRLLIHCPNPETQTALSKQSQALAQRTGCARRLVLKYSGHPDITVEPCNFPD